MTTETLGSRLKYARQRANCSQEELARRTHVSKAAISKIEMGITKDCLAGSLYEMADALAIDPRWLATGRSLPSEVGFGVPGESGLMEAWAALPEDVSKPLREMMESIAEQASQRYWRWIEERDQKKG